jgi:transcriptional regulator with XRE-family HTH domain
MKVTQGVPERGARLRRERRRLGWSQATVAARAGVHPNSVRLAELGAGSAAMLQKIADALEQAVEK